MDKREAAFLEKTLAFLGSMKLVPKRKWFLLDVAFGSQVTPCVRLSIGAKEWALLVKGPKKQTAIYAKPDGTWTPWDDFGLAKRVRSIGDVTKRFGEIEKALGTKVPREVFVKSDIAGAKKAVDAWVAKL